MDWNQSRTIVININYIDHKHKSPYHQRNSVSPPIKTTHEVHTLSPLWPPEQGGYGGRGGRRSEIFAHELPSDDLVVGQLDEMMFE